MKRARGYIFSILFLSLFTLNSEAQTPSVSPELQLQVKGFYTKPLQHSKEDLRRLSSFEEYLSRLEVLKARKKSDTDFLKSVFFKTHRKYLKQYNASATFEQMMNTGIYGCLTGTALYSIILSHFGYEHEIIELTGHVYLKVKLKDQVILMESTLPQGGFLENVSAIAKATQRYEDESRTIKFITAISGIDTEDESTTFKRNIGLRELSGLQFYNMAIYNMKDEALETAFVNAQAAIGIYPSKRTEKLMEIVINKILQSKNLTKDLKSGVLNTYITQVKKRRLTQRGTKK